MGFNESYALLEAAVSKALPAPPTLRALFNPRRSPITPVPTSPAFLAPSGATSALNDFCEARSLFKISKKPASLNGALTPARMTGATSSTLMAGNGFGVSPAS